MSVRNVDDDLANWLRAEAGRQGKSREQFLRDVFAEMRLLAEKAQAKANVKPAG